MFARLWNLEALAVIFGGLAIVVGLSLDSDLGTQTIFPVAAWLAISIPLAMSAQSAVIPLYLRLGLYQRALDLAITIRESAPPGRARAAVGLDVAMVQVALGRFEDALRNLEAAKEHHFKEHTRALLKANRAYCRAHLGRDLERALAEAEEACAALPEEGILEYVRGLCLHKLGREEEARIAIEASLEREPDPDLPVPAERPFVLAEVLQRLGQDALARERLAEARRRARRSPFRDAIEAASAAAGA